MVLILSFSCFAQDQSTGPRKLVSKTVAEYPQIARNMHLGGVVKVDAIVSPNGSVKAVAVRGGPPILAGAAADAVRKWKWIPANHETREPVEVKFTPYE
jgi:TonB family protein